MRAQIDNHGNLLFRGMDFRMTVFPGRMRDGGQGFVLILLGVGFGVVGIPLNVLTQGLDVRSAAALAVSLMLSTVLRYCSCLAVRA